jgi:hypothetical protein
MALEINQAQLAAWQLACFLHEPFAEACWLLHRAISGRRFLLPKYRRAPEIFGSI